MTKFVTLTPVKERDMSLELYADAVLTCDVPQHRLKRDDIVKLVDYHVAPDGTKGYSIESVKNGGDPIGTVRVTKQLQLIRLILREEALDLKIAAGDYSSHGRKRPFLDPGIAQ
jgi:hypothetical protein